MRLEERKRLVISGGETIHVPTTIAIQVRCTSCKEATSLSVPIETLHNYTEQADGTFEAPWKVCEECAEWSHVGYSIRDVWWFIIAMSILCVWIAYLATR
jgi:hypothetical protein